MRWLVNKSHPACFAACAFLASAAPGAALAEWTKSYVVTWNEPAFYYGSKGGPADPGTDCPAGAQPDLDWFEIMGRGGYSPEQVRWLLDPDNKEISGERRMNQLAFRGKDRANVYGDPTSTPDPGLIPVTGKIAEGINLDGDATTGFISPTGDKGVDNQFYRAIGCLKFYRAPPGQAGTTATGNENARAGTWTLVIVISGKGDDPMNDDDVDLGVYMSSDRVITAGAGAVAARYTFRIRPHAQYEATFKGKVVDGRVTTEATPRVFIRDANFGYGLELLQARADFTMQSDGSLKGYLGGYQPWGAVYDGLLSHRGWVMERSLGIEMPALWYALRRNADYSPTGSGGEKTHISSALRIDAVAAYVTGPDGKALVSSVKSYKAQAPKDEPLIQQPKRSWRIVEGLRVGDGEEKAVPLTEEQLQPSSAWLKKIAAANGGAE
ncbi:MAG: hypothetical protein AB7P23_11325 [Amphiplicatus sp.]